MTDSDQTYTVLYQAIFILFFVLRFTLLKDRNTFFLYFIKCLCDRNKLNVVGICKILLFCNSKSDRKLSIYEIITLVW